MKLIFNSIIFTITTFNFLLSEKSNSIIKYLKKNAKTPGYGWERYR